MIYASRYLLATLLIVGSLAALYFLPLGRLLHYVWVYYQVAIVGAVVVIPLLYMVRVVSLKIVHALAAKMPQPDEHALAETSLVSQQPFAAAKPLAQTELQLP